MSRPPVLRLVMVAACLAVALALAPRPAAAQGADPNACDDPSEAPDVIVGDLHELRRWGRVGDITSFSVGTFSCNVGTCWLNWLTGNGDNRHPTIGQNLFRLKDGRFEQIGQSWLKHGFFALSEEICGAGCLATDGEHLGVNCSDPYSSDLNGQQSRLGPKFEVNPLTGFHPHPVTDQRLTGDAIYKRLQVHDADIDPDLNPGALWYIEGQYVAEDDAAAGNQHNNASYRRVQPFRGGGQLSMALQDETQRTKPAILAWQANDPEVEVVVVDDPQGGRYYVAGKATDLGGGTWHYEYAVQNLTSHRAARAFTVPVPVAAVLSAVGFHDVDYHSGEPFDLTDWPSDTSVPGAITWATAAFATNENANALRWGTLYNFRFDADRPPGRALLTLGLFRPGNPGEPDSVTFALVAPDACNGNGTCDPGESCVSCPGECGADAGPDGDGDGRSICADCDDADASRWGRPSEVPLLLATRGPAGEVDMTWDPPADPGSSPPLYEVLRSGVASDFATGPACLRDQDPARAGLSDADAPAAGPRLYYLARATVPCGATLRGTTGANSLGVERVAADCP